MADFLPLVFILPLVAFGDKVEHKYHNHETGLPRTLEGNCKSFIEVRFGHSKTLTPLRPLPYDCISHFPGVVLIPLQRLLLVSTAAIALAQAVWAQQPKIAAKSGGNEKIALRVLDFPAQSLGVLTRNNGSFYKPDLVTIGPARGRLIMRSTERLTLAANLFLAQHTEYLNKLPPDALYGLEFSSIDTDDQPIELKNVASLTGLRYLRVSGCMITDGALAYLKSLTHLRKLELWGCGIKGTALKISLPLMPELENLHLGQNPLCLDALKAAGQLKDLRVFRLGQSNVNDVMLAEIAKLPRLDVLSLSKNPEITKNGLGQLHSCKNLKDIDVSKCGLSADSILALKGMPLKAILLSTAKFKKGDLEMLHKAFPGATITDADPVDSTDKFLFSPLHY